MKNVDLMAEPWSDYELIDSGDNKKLERYGKYIVIRPETQAIWKPSRPAEWKEAQAEFAWNGGKGAWKNKGVPESWEMSWGDVRFTARLTSFKHTGIFPEQSVNWEWLAARVAALKEPQVLNLFGYTGIASIVAAKNGATVTHIDASKQSNLWAKENAKLSDVPEGAMRVLLDDALRFAEREVRRSHVYEGIVLDPPAFGRGPENEVWRIEEDIQKLLGVLAKLLAKKPGSFFLLNGYAAGYSPQSFLQAVGGSFPEAKNAEFGEIAIRERTSDRIVPSGIYLRFVR
ncbi:class I SAM-dependent methyltransferase [Patescibacteria group bacterium]|nr:class I SAM-dependent methyltransferase [Patescibacteria group bacterium]MCL5114623.1 class I SAM-dependent methyltransferase [Patescibacteria group bacterium]